MQQNTVAAKPPAATLRLRRRGGVYLMAPREAGMGDCAPAVGAWRGQRPSGLAGFGFEINWRVKG